MRPPMVSHPWIWVESCLFQQTAIGSGKLDGKVIFSTSNPFGGRDAGVGRKALHMGVALADQPYLPGVHLVQAFNAWSGLGLHLEHGAQKNLG